jgi:hypothetical protein
VTWEVPALKTDAAVAAWCHDAIQWASAGEVARGLTRRRVRPPAGEAEWTTTLVHRLAFEERARRFPDIGVVARAEHLGGKIEKE